MVWSESGRFTSSINFWVIFIFIKQLIIILNSVSYFSVRQWSQPIKLLQITNVFAENDVNDGKPRIGIFMKQLQKWATFITIKSKWLMASLFSPITPSYNTTWHRIINSAIYFLLSVKLSCFVIALNAAVKTHNFSCRHFSLNWNFLCQVFDRRYN